MCKLSRDRSLVTGRTLGRIGWVRPVTLCSGSAARSFAQNHLLKIICPGTFAWNYLPGIIFPNEKSALSAQGILLQLLS
jgi:hypothetical protein